MSTHDHAKATRRIASAETEEELMEKVVAHAKHDHGVTEVTPELAEKVKAAIVRQ